MLTFLALFAAGSPLRVAAQSPDDITVRGMVVNAAGEPVDRASVSLVGNRSGPPIETRTNAAGAFSFASLPAGTYQIQAAKAESHSPPAMVDASSTRAVGSIRLVITGPAAMEFADQPNFTVAGVTDWTAVGGHGSDATLRTSEDLARETAALKAQGEVRSASPASHSERDLVIADENAGDLTKAREHLTALLAQKDDADLRRLLAEVDERAGDPLAAVREYQQAARMDPSEQNYFAWGSELLLHRAVWQAVEVFRNGNRLHPASARMLTALGTALFAGDLFQEAVDKLCAASDLKPMDDATYRFMGRVVIASPEPLHCAEPRLERFAQKQPQSAQANYLYAMAVWKRLQHTPEKERKPVQTLLEKAVADDPRCAEAWLQLGIMAAERQQPAEAIGYYSRALEADPQLGEAHYRLGVTYDRAGQAEKARQEFKLHDEIEQSQAAAVERQRREVKQFLVTLQGKPSATH